MSRQVLYVAAPLRPTEEEIEATPSHTSWQNPGRSLDEGGRQISRPQRVQVAIRANIDRALRWLAWPRKSFPETTFIAPWICDILSGADDSDEAQREAGMQGNFAVIERCDGIVLCGPRISQGMRMEMEHGRTHSNVVMEYEGDPNAFRVFNLVCDPPGEPLPFIGPMPHAFSEWAALFAEEGELEGMGS